MTKFPNPFELLNRNLENMENIEDSPDTENTANDEDPSAATDLAGVVQDEAISVGQKGKNSKYVDYIYPLVVVVLTFLGNWFVYSNTFGNFFKEETINKKMQEVEKSNFWVMNYIVQLFIYLYISISIVLFFILYFIFDILDFNYLYYTFIIHLVITGFLLIILALLPSFVEIFENSIGLSMLKLIYSREIKENVFGKFDTKIFPNSNIDLSFFLTIFSPGNFKNTFNDFIRFSVYNDNNREIFSDLKYKGFNEVDGSLKPDLDNKLKDFLGDDADKANDAIKDNKMKELKDLKNKLFELVIKKYENGHFIWTYFSSIISIFTVLIYMN